MAPSAEPERRDQEIGDSRDSVNGWESDGDIGEGGVDMYLVERAADGSAGGREPSIDRGVGSVSRRRHRRAVVPLGVATAALGLLLAAVAPAGAAASGGAATRGRGSGSVSDSAGLDYFVALGSSETKDDSADGTQFDSFNRQLGSGSFTGPEGSASATSKLTASVNDLATLSLAKATGSVSGSTHRASSTNTPGIPVADADADFSLGYDVAGPTPTTVSVSLSASDSSPDDCTEADATLFVDGTEMTASKRAGGDCSPSSGPSSLSFSGVISGGLQLDVSLSGSAAAERKGSSTSFSGAFGVTISAPFGDCTITGTPDGETLNGTPDADVICGMGGVDRLNGLGGNDKIFGAGDNDIIHGGDGSDILHGEDADDTLVGGPGGDTIFGDRGCDDIIAGDGEDVVLAGSGGTPTGDTDVCDDVDGGAGNDDLAGQGDVDNLVGGPGNDSLDGGPGSDFLDDSSGPNAHLEGGAGNDNVCGSAQADVIEGGPDDDKISAGLGSDTVHGDGGNDQIAGNFSFAVDPAGDICAQSLGSDGGDVLDGGPGDDFVVGDEGPDHLTGGPGSDKLQGASGADTLSGGTRKDVLNGGTENDVLNACDGVLDTVIGGPGGADFGKVDQGVDDVHADVEHVTSC
jgi:Ca2+-binding RTX toxin-like protein